ncbi:nuclear transport factor 2 family protein [Streptomyces sp. NPDC088387]|uniref:nuclear transport factor 2 family protein n=1 Tax=Streptomyces sp. NPDC088387 TaxID=3365859 RepID=UPI0037F96A2F
MKDGVQAAVENYVKGVSENDPEIVASAFREDAYLWGFLGDTEVVAMPVSEFLKVVSKAPDPSQWIADYTHRIRSIEVSGDTAIAVLEESGYLGADFTNYFTLVNQGGQWKIASKTFNLTGGTLPVPPEG